MFSVAHYGEQNSDLMRDPEMLFEVAENGGVSKLRPFYFRNDYVAVEQWSRYRNGSGDLVSLPQRTREMEAFAKIWDRNLRSQAFLRPYGENLPRAVTTITNDANDRSGGRDE